MQGQTLTRRIGIAEAADVLGVSKDTIRRMISSGEIPAYRIGRKVNAPIRLNLEDVEACARPIPTAGSAAGK